MSTFNRIYEKIGYDDIKTTETGEYRVSLFKELVDNKTSPLVFFRL